MSLSVTKLLQTSLPTPAATRNTTPIYTQRPKIYSHFYPTNLKTKKSSNSFLKLFFGSLSRVIIGSYEVSIFEARISVWILAVLNSNVFIITYVSISCLPKLKLIYFIQYQPHPIRHFEGWFCSVFVKLYCTLYLDTPWSSNFLDK